MNAPIQVPKERLTATVKKMTDSKDKEKAAESEAIEPTNEAEEAAKETEAAAVDNEPHVDNEPQEREPAEAASTNESKSASPLPLAFSILAILGVVLLGAGGYWFANEQQRLLLEQQALLQSQQQQLQSQIAESAKSAESDRNDLRAKVDTISAGLAGSERDIVAHREIVDIQKAAFEKQTEAFEKQQQQFEAESKRLQQREAELQATLEDVRRSIGRTGSQWMAAEAEYLMRVANHRLRLERDEKTALSALRAADERLKATGDPLWTEVREALAKEMSDLLALVKLDTIGKAATLASMIKQVDKLKLLDASAPEIHVETKTSEALDLNSAIAKAKELLEQGWAGFKSLVIVRRHDAPVTAMMPPEHRYFIYQNLRMQLEAARFAILRADAELYKSSLTTVKEWLDEFVVKDPTAQAMAEEIEGLLKVNIRPELPDISGSLRLLREKMKVVGMEAPAP